jgi:hypothetical protein
MKVQASDVLSALTLASTAASAYGSSTKSNTVTLATLTGKNDQGTLRALVNFPSLGGRPLAVGESASIEGTDKLYSKGAGGSAPEKDVDYHVGYQLGKC